MNQGGSCNDGRQTMATILDGKKRVVCDGSEQKSPHAVGTKNPCITCGHMTTTKRDGTQRRHVPKKSKK
jgi:hypothetical protein